MAVLNSEIVGAVFAATGVLGTKFGEMTQDSPDSLNIFPTILHPVVKGQLSNIMLPSFAIFGLASIMAYRSLGVFEKVDEQSRSDISFSVGVFCSLLFSLSYIGLEISAMLTPEKFPNCGQSSTVLCPGDFSDVLAFSIPTISFAIFSGISMLNRHRTNSHRSTSGA